MGDDYAIKDIQSIHSRILDLPPSCIEFSPISRDYFVVGTYYLERNEDATGASIGEEENASASLEEKKSQSRRGSLILFRYVNDQLTLLQALPTPSALLDLHFSPHDPSVFATATSTGTISLHRLTLSPDSSATTPAYIQHLSTYQVLEPSVLILAFAFHPLHSNLIGVSLSNGDISIYQLPSTSTSATSASLSNPGEVHKIWTASSAHSLEAWTLSFSPDGSTLFSGGDDSKLQAYSISDVRPQQDDALHDEQEEELDEPLILWFDVKTHGAGVTAILPLPVQDEASSATSPKILITGSYDDHIRVYEYPSPGLPGRRRVLAEAYLGGGVWRLKVLKDYQERDNARENDDAPDTSRLVRVRILASCMHAGARVLDITRKDDQWDIAVLGKFEEHKSMNYGSDVQPLTVEEGDEDDGGGSGEFTIVSTSFYDRLLCVWTCER